MRNFSTLGTMRILVHLLAHDLAQCDTGHIGRTFSHHPWGRILYIVLLVSRGGVFCGSPAFSISLVGLRGSFSFVFFLGFF